MKIKDLVKVEGSLNNLVGIVLKNGLDNYNVYKFYRQLKEELDNFKAQKNKLIMEYGTRTHEGNFAVLPDNPNFSIVLEQINSLEKIEVDIEISNIKLNPEEVNISPFDLVNLVDIGLIEIVVKE